MLAAAGSTLLSSRLFLMQRELLVSCLSGAGQELSPSIGMDDKKCVFRLWNSALAILLVRSQVSEKGRV